MLDPARQQSLARRLVAEGLGTSFLLIAVVGSGIMADRLFSGNTGLALLANSIATGAALVALIVTFGPISGAHINPAVTLAVASQKGLSWRDAGAYVGAQIAGAVVGVAVANAMFGEPVFAASVTVREGGGQLLGEFIATFGLLAVIWSATRRRPEAVAMVVGCYITGAYWFTSSTSFANPAVTVARALTNTFTGIRPSDVPGFLVAQLLGAAAATILLAWLVPALPERAPSVVVPRDVEENHSEEST
jgi:glycerol uptake facilitator-like aquaporin